MKPLTNIKLLTGAAFLAGSISAAQAVNVVTNGEFETPVSASGNLVVSSIGAGWTTTDGGAIFELWQEASPAGSPVAGSDGLDSGQALEINASTGSSTSSVSYTFTVPATVDVASASTFKFDAWQRDDNLDVSDNGSAVFSVYQNAALLFGPTAVSATNDAWSMNSISVAGGAFAAGDSIELRWDGTTATTNAVDGIQIDQVSFDFADTVIPEPTTATLFGLGGLLMFLRRRR